MRKLLIVILLVNFTSINSQEIKCLNSEFYNPIFELVRIKNETDSIKNISKCELNSDTIKLYVFNNTFKEFPKWSSFKRKGIHSGFKIILLNNSSSDFEFLIKGNRIDIKRQVFYKNEWKDLAPIKKTADLFCGTGYYKNGVLRSKNFFTFLAPCIEGKLKVKSRFVFGNNIYSNEFEGFIDEKFIKQ